MKTLNYIALCICLAILISAAPTSSPLTSSAAEEPTTLVSVEDIGKKVALIGRLGQPLGTTMEVKGTWRMPDIRVKDYSPRFTVSHVNGKALKKPVEFNVAQIEAVSRRDTNAVPDARSERLWTELPGQYARMKPVDSMAARRISGKNMAVVQKRRPIGIALLPQNSWASFRTGNRRPVHGPSFA